LTRKHTGLGFRETVFGFFVVHACRQWLRLHPNLVNVEGAWGGPEQPTTPTSGAGVYHLLRDIEMLRRAGTAVEATGAVTADDDVMGTNVPEVMVVGPALAGLMARIHGLLVQFPDNAVLQVGIPPPAPRRTVSIADIATYAHH
jgi:hypothetical protein